MKIGIFYQMWHENKKAAYDSLQQLRKVYPDNEIVMLITGVNKDNVEQYEKEFIDVIKSEFNISKVDHLLKDDFVGYCDHTRNIDDLLHYNDVLLEKTFYMLDESTDFVLFGSEDLYIFKEIPINPECDVCGNPRMWDAWMKEEMKQKFDYSKNDKILWFQHGHYLNLKKFKQVFTKETREYINNTLKELYPNSQSIFSDYYTSIWCTLACDTFCRADYLLELPSEITDETPLETFNRTQCHARHGYKKLYKQPL